MVHSLENTIALLERTPAALDALLRGLPEEWTHRNEGGGTFTAVDVVGHLIYADRANWLPRARTILEHGETKPLDSFDRLGHVEECRGKTLPQILDEFRRVRTESVGVLRALNLTPAQLELRGRASFAGRSHAVRAACDVGGTRSDASAQISRILAHQYREQVGPFSTFLGVLKCEGHGG